MRCSSHYHGNAHTMLSWILSGVVIAVAMGWRGAATQAQEHGPVFLMEPPPRLVFANSTGARVSCAAHGFPPPRLAWQLADGSPVDDVPGLRQVLENGTLVLQAFAASQYRQDVHAAVYRCRAHNAHGAIVSRDMRTQADYSINAPPTFKPTKKYSDISGLPASYVDRHSSLYYSNAEEFATVRSLPMDITAGYLQLRGVNTIVG